MACWIVLILGDLLFGLPDPEGIDSGSLVTSAGLVVWQALSFRTRVAQKNRQMVRTEQSQPSASTLGMARVVLFLFGAVNLCFSLYQHLWHGPHWAGVVSFGLMGLICMLVAVAVPRRGFKAG